MPVQVRLAAPIFKSSVITRRASACAAGIPNPRGLGAAPGRRANFYVFIFNSGVAKWQGSGFIRRVSPVRIRPPQPVFHRAARSFSRSSALQAEEHGAKPWRSTMMFGLLAQQRRAAACRAEGRGSNARTGRQFSRSRARESANPPRLERGGTRGSTGARDQFSIPP